MKVIAEEARGREAMCRQLEEAAAKLPADSNRAMYTRRILEIVRNINRQKDDISKVCVCVCVCVCVRIYVYMCDAM